MMTKNDKKPGIDMRQVKYIASVGHCPKCGSDSVKFRLPFESYLETKDKELIKVVLDFSSPQNWLRKTVTTCVECGHKFHLRDDNNDFYQGLEKSKNEEGNSSIKWSYDFNSYKQEE
jgi:hypothetical protein